jgi:F-type H+-transporting ATPase subunit delta
MATYTDALAQVYARSLYELADEAGGRDKIVEVSEEIEQIGELARGDRSFGEFLASPIINKGERSRSLRQIFDGNVTDLTLRFLLVLNEKGRLGHLEAIDDAYDQLVHEAFGRVEVDLYTAAPLDAQELESIKERIRKALGKEPVVYAYTEPSMIGGLKLRIGDQLIDGSVSNRLRRLKQSMKASGFSALRNRLASLIEEGDT